MRLFIIFLLFLTSSCITEEKNNFLFKKIKPSHSGINFKNNLSYTEEINPYTYRNFYNGGGVGIGDINNDSLPDIFFTGNLVSNKLYLNKGNFIFQDISQSAGITSDNVWSTGVSMVDINHDGYLDIYVCKSGPPSENNNRHNELFINNGDLTFTEMSKQYGLDNNGLSTHAAFFDYDQDGDLDCYLLNNTIRSVGIGFDLRKDQRNIPNKSGGNKLYRNENNFFVDVSEESGIYTSAIGFGLGVTIGDVNMDDWPDIYVSNDFFEKDYLYINNKDGSFKESLEDYITELSMGSMGADMSDINNDGNSEIFVTEMLPIRHDRIMSKTVYDSWDKYKFSLDQGYYHQFSRNVLQLNNGNGSFSDISRIAGVDATDWSWGALIFDMDKDGLKDIFVANGIYKDLLDQDYVNFMANPSIISNMIKTEKNVITKLIDMIPSEPIPNFAFKNLGNLSFDNVSNSYGFSEPTFSNGSAYGDLDNDGDLDLVLNNVNMNSFVYENLSEKFNPDKNFLSFTLEGEGKNSKAIGSKVILHHNNKIYYQELNPMRGFQSSVDYRLFFGLDTLSSIDTIKIIWPNQNESLLTNVNTNQNIYINQITSNKKIKEKSHFEKKVLFNEVADDYGIDFIHKENDFVDFDRQRLLFTMSSNETPCLCKGYINLDSLEDFFVGNSKGYSSAIFIQKSNGKFDKIEKPFEPNKNSEDTDCVIFDANNDGINDIYITSGGNEFNEFSTDLFDRLYFGDGKGEFIKSEQTFPLKMPFQSTSTVSYSDFDNDGDYDLFVGGRLESNIYGLPSSSFLFLNNGDGVFLNKSDSIAPAFKFLGMVTDSKWVDLDNDNDDDLIVVGEWMPIKVFINVGDSLVDKSIEYGFDKTNGWNHAIEVSDFNNDGFYDIIIGNYGLNSRLKASEKYPLTMLVNDFDNNGNVEQILGMYRNESLYPIVQLKDLWMQIPSLKKKYLKFENYKNEKLFDLFEEDVLTSSLKLYTYKLNTSLWINKKGINFSEINLPFQSQFSPVYAIISDDINLDGNKDIIMGGNQYRIKPEIGIHDASYVSTYLGDGKGNFKYLDNKKSGIFIRGQLRDIIKIKRKKEENFIFALNNDSLKILKLNQ